MTERENFPIFLHLKWMNSLLLFSTKYSDIKARWFVHSSTNAIIMLIEVKGRSVGHRDAEKKKNFLLQN